MANKTPAKKRADARVIELDPSAGADPKLKGVGGSNFDSWNRVLVNQAMCSGWFGHTADKDMAREQNIAYLEFLRGVRPRDELEGMLAAQLLASHNAAMECYRRAMVPEQTFEGRSEALTQANKLSRTFTTLLEAPEPTSRQRPAKGHGGARSRARRWPSGCGCSRAPRGRECGKFEGSIPCKAAYP